MAQVSMTVRMDAGIKAAFDSLCQQFGMSANAAMNIFANAVVKTRSIPFKIEAPAQDNAGFCPHRESLLPPDSSSLGGSHPPIALQCLGQTRGPHRGALDQESSIES